MHISFYTPSMYMFIYCIQKETEEKITWVWIKYIWSKDRRDTRFFGFFFFFSCSFYTKNPPVFERASTRSMAARMSSFCKCEHFRTSSSFLFNLMDGSRDITPMPVHGASRRSLFRFFFRS